jgi:predicted outer membrane repeat protein
MTMDFNVASANGFSLKGTKYYVFSSTLVQDGKHQIYAGNSLLPSAFKVPAYMSAFNDFTPFVDPLTYKVYFASDRFGKGNFDLYRYNTLTYEQYLMPSVPYTMPTAVYVSTSGSDVSTGLTPADPLLTIQKAIQVAVSNSISNVFIAAGTYIPGTGLNASGSGVLVTNSALMLWGGWDPTFKYPFTGYSELDGMGGLSHVIFVSNVQEVYLIGFVLRNANAVAASPDDAGGGLLVESSEICGMVDLIVSNNTATNGGGISIRNSQFVTMGAGYPLSVLNNTAFNHGGGIYFENASNNNLIYAYIETNIGYGGGGGVYIGGTSDANQIAAVIISNFATNGGGIYVASDNQFINNSMILNNGIQYAFSSKGNGVYIDVPGLTSISIANCVLTNYELQGSIIETAQPGNGPGISIYANMIGSKPFGMNNTIAIQAGTGADITNYRIQYNTFLTNNLRYLYKSLDKGLNVDPMVNLGWTNINNTNVTGASIAEGNTVSFY